MDNRPLMHQALDRARQALAAGEFPVGCVIAEGPTVVASAARSGSSGDRPNEVDHAEMRALHRLATGGIDPARRSALALYTTMEPCLMCYGAILLSGIGTVVYAYEDVMGGASGCDLASLGPLYRERAVRVVPHVLRRESLALFKAFFSRPDNAYWRESLLARYTLTA